MAAPVWFDYKAYFNNKLALLNESDSVFDSLGGGYNDLTLKAAFEAAGYSVDADGLYQHFVDFGNAEGISPNAWFNTEEYLYNKAADYFNSSSVTPQMVESMRLAMMNSGMSAWDHYDQYWAESYEKDGSFNNPSTSFDVSAYMNAKLAQMQAENPDYTMDDLVADFVAAGLSPVEHYVAYGAAEGIVPTPVTDGTGNTYQLTEDTDAIYGTSGDDFFNAEVGGLYGNTTDTLGSADYIDGMGGNDTLYAHLNNASAINPSIVNVENVFFQSQGSNNNAIDAERISLADGQTLTLGSVNSRTNLTIDDVRHNSTETVIRFQNADPDVTLTVEFDPQHLTREGAQTSGVMSVQLMDVQGADEFGQPLKQNPFDTFTFQYTDNNGEAKNVTLDLGKVDGDATYLDLVAAFNAALAESGYGNLISASLGNPFESSTTVSGVEYSSDLGYSIKLTCSSGSITTRDEDGKQIEGTGWGVSAGGVPDQGGITWAVDSTSSDTCPLISTSVELDNVGRVQWDSTSACLPDDSVYGSEAGDLLIGSMANRGGVERLDVTVDKGSWLSSLASTNDSLRMVTVTNGAIDGANDKGNLFIGDSLAAGGQATVTWVNVPRLLNTNGLSDVKVFDASAMEGKVNIGAQITDAAYDIYMKDVDGVDSMAEGYAPNGAFKYYLGSNDDTLNMGVSGDIAADADFVLDIQTNSGNDLVQFAFGEMTYVQSVDQKNLQNVSISTGEGDDTVWFVSSDDVDSGTPVESGAVVVDAGSGNDTLYLNQEVFNPTFGFTPNNYNAVFVFNSTATDIAVDGNNGATLLNDTGVGSASFEVTNATAGEGLYVTVSFLGYSQQVKIMDVAANTTSVSAETINHAIMQAIAENDVLSKLLVAKDGAAHTLLIESIINGERIQGDLSIDFSVLAADGKTGQTIFNTGNDYDTQFATEPGTPNEFTGNNSVNTAVVVDGGAGNDVIVLGPNGDQRDVVVLNGSFGNDAIIGFDAAHDRINVAGLGLKELVDGAGALTNLAANAVSINATLNAEAANGVFSSAEVSKLFSDETIGVAENNTGTSLLFLRDVDHQNVYTVVQMNASGAIVLGSFTVDDNTDPIAFSNLTMSNDLGVVQLQTYDAYTATSGTTFTGQNWNEQYNNLNATDLNTITTVNALAGNDVLNINGDINTRTINGGAGDDSFTISGLSTTVTGGTLNGGTGSDTLTITADRAVALIEVSGIEKISATGDQAVTFTALNADTATSIDFSALTGVATVDASNSTAAVTITAGTGALTFTSGKGDDTITLGEGATDAIVFGNSLAANGYDIIKGLEASDTLNVDSFLTKQIASTLVAKDATSDDLNIGNGATDNIGVLYNVAGGILDASKIVTSSTVENGEVVIDADTNAVIFVTASETNSGSDILYNMYYVTGATNSDDVKVELVGTVTSDAALAAANIA